MINNLKLKLHYMIDRMLNRYGYYHKDDLVAGGNCGCCGRWMPDLVAEKIWAWGLCDVCIRRYPIKNSEWIGRRFYDVYFQQYGTVVRYLDEKNWWFKLDRNEKVFKAVTSAKNINWLN